MLKHNLLAHGEMENIEFDMKVLQEHKTAIQRQIHEAVMIQNHKGPILMNSKSEFSRCRIPRLTVKFGNKDEKNKEEESELLTEQMVEAAIKKLKQKQRREDLKLEEDKPPGKRRRVCVVKERRGMKRGRPLEIEGSEKVCEVGNICKTVEERVVAELNKTTAELADQKANLKQKQTKIGWGLAAHTQGKPSKLTEKSPNLPVVHAQGKPSENLTEKSPNLPVTVLNNVDVRPDKKTTLVFDNCDDKEENVESKENDTIETKYEKRRRRR